MYLKEKKIMTFTAGFSVSPGPVAGGLLHNASLLKIMKIRENPFKPSQVQLNCWGGVVIYIFPPLQAVVYSEGFTLLTLHLSLVVSLGRDPRKIRLP